MRNTAPLLFVAMTAACVTTRAVERRAAVESTRSDRARAEREACATAATDACHRRGAVSARGRLDCMAARIERCEARFASETLLVASRADGEDR